ncbi:MAG TPA: glycosyltransferase family 1 protein [Burkholderiaceae bacterium]|nr:glycosyltransferase family 1 protein [Burkholderiaceae bacterium]
MNNPAQTIVVDDFPVAHRSLRIALVTETYPPEVNGVARTLAQVVEGLRARNHELQLLRPRQSAADQAGADARFHEVLMRGLPMPRYPALKIGLPAKNALVRLWTTRRPDLVHIATEGPLGWSALQAAKRLRLPVTSDFRTNFHAYSKHYGAGWLHKPIMLYLRKFHNATQCTMVPTEALRRSLVEYGFRDVFVVARGVDTRLFDPARRSEALRRSWAVAPDQLVVLYVGRLAPEKNLEALAQAFASLRQRRADAKLVLVGDGPAARAIQSLCPDAVFAGMRAAEDLAAHYASADLFLFPSLTETFGNVTPEAMASGLPVVAFDYAAAAQIVASGRNGMLAPFGDSAAFVGLATELAGDAARRRAMGRHARHTAEQMNWDRIIVQIEERFMAVLVGAHAQAVQPQLLAS